MRIERIMTIVFRFAGIVRGIGGRGTVIEDIFDEQDAIEYIPLGPEIQESEQGPNNNLEGEPLEPLQEESDNAPNLNIRDIDHNNPVERVSGL